MLKIYKNYKGETQEITNFCKNVSISCSLKDVARKLECTIVYPLNDPYQIRQQLNPSTKVWVTLNNKEIFRGIVIDRTITTADELQFTAFDYAFYLKKNTITRNYKNITVDCAVRDILSEIGIDRGNIASSNIKLRRLLAQKKVYDAIMELYTQVSKQNKKQYYIYMTGLKVNIEEIGARIAKKVIKPCKNVFVGDGNLLEFSYKDSMGNMINRIKIYDDKNNYISKVENLGDIKTYGILQDNYVKEKDKNANIVASNILHSIDTEVECTVLGDYEYLTGTAVNVMIPYIDNLADNVMYIESDTHTWDTETGTYTTNLTLKYDAEMDEKESDDTQKFDAKMEKERIRNIKKAQREQKKRERELKRKGKKRK